MSNHMSVHFIDLMTGSMFEKQQQNEVNTVVEQAATYDINKISKHQVCCCQIP